MHAGLDLEVHLSDELITIRAQDRDVFEDDIVGEHDLCTLSGLLEHFILGSVGDSGGVVSRRRCNHDALIVATTEIFEDFVHLVDEGGVSRQILDLLVGDNKTADGLRQVNQKRRVANVILRDLSLIITELRKVLAALRTEDGQANDSVANHDGAILDQHRVIDAHQESLLQHKADMGVKPIETVVDVFSLPFVSIVEGDLLGMSEKIAVEGSVFTFESLFLGGKSTESRGDEADNESRETVPSESDGRAFPSDEFGELLGEEEHVKEWLDKVDVQARKTGGPLVSILGQTLIGVSNTVVQVANLVVMHVVQIVFVEVLGESCAEQETKLLLNVVDS